METVDKTKRLPLRIQLLGLIHFIIILIMESYPQPESMKLYLSELLVKDPYNKYCVDCTKNESTHANISHGTFVCLNCANILMNEFGMEKCYIKGIFNDLWDTY